MADLRLHGKLDVDPTTIRPWQSITIDRRGVKAGADGRYPWADLGRPAGAVHCLDDGFYEIRTDDGTVSRWLAVAGATHPCAPVAIRQVEGGCAQWTITFPLG